MGTSQFGNVLYQYTRANLLIIINETPKVLKVTLKARLIIFHSLDGSELLATAPYLGFSISSISISIKKYHALRTLCKSPMHTNLLFSHSDILLLHDVSDLPVDVEVPHSRLAFSYSDNSQPYGSIILTIDNLGVDRADE